MLLFAAAAVHADGVVHLVDYRRRERADRTVSIIPPRVWANVHLESLWPDRDRGERKTAIESAVLSRTLNSPVFRTVFRSVDVCSTLIVPEIKRREFDLGGRKEFEMLLPVDGSPRMARSEGPDFFLFLSVTSLVDEIDSIATKISLRGIRELD
jgi:hypothetical protein